MDFVIAYLYSLLDNDIYMNLHKGLNLLEAYKSGSQEQYSIKLNKSLYRLKQSRRMWYNHLSEYLLKERPKKRPNLSMYFYEKI